MDRIDGISDLDLLTIPALAFDESVGLSWIKRVGPIPLTDEKVTLAVIP
jgi:hypothetical protein